MTRLLRHLAVLALLSPLSLALAATDLQVGVIASRSTKAGAAQTIVATAWAAQLRAAGGVFGQPVRLLLADDGGDPGHAVSLAKDQLEAGALTIICCTTPAATLAVAEFAEAAGVTLLTPTDWQAPATGNYWAFSLAPSDTDAAAAIVADAYRSGRAGLALLAPDDAAADAAADDLGALGALVGIRLVSDTRYPPGQTEVRPEALLVATSRPGAVVLWGGPSEVARAAAALERRGYEGPVYGRTAALYQGGDPLPWRSLAGVRFPVPPALIAAPGDAAARVLPGERDGGPLGTCADAATRDAARLLQAANDPQPLWTAPVLAGLDLVSAAFEQFLALQVPLGDAASQRQAVRDALVGLPTQCSGAGALDLEDGRRSGVLPRSLAIGVATPTGMAPD